VSAATAEVLRRAREVIATPERWTKGALYRVSKRGASCDDIAEATCFCGYGAVQKVTGTRNAQCLLACDALDGVVGGDFPSWQDKPGRRHREVLSAFDRAIAAEEASQ
jgi:hypothetical protein